MISVIIRMIENACCEHGLLGSFTAIKNVYILYQLLLPRTVSEESLTAWCLDDRLPLIHMTVDLRVANDSLHLNHPMREQ